VKPSDFLGDRARSLGRTTGPRGDRKLPRCLVSVPFPTAAPRKSFGDGRALIECPGRPPEKCRQLARALARRGPNGATNPAPAAVGD
jgi:hypothetical protein